MAGFTQETATARLARLLTMVPWLVNRQGIDLQEAADDLGVSVEQLEADLNLLFLCGYGQMPDELIEADWEEGRVFVGNADTIARPLRLGVDEAVTLVVGLRALREVPGLGERDAVERALAKLEDAAGAAAAPARRVRAEVADGALARAAGPGPAGDRRPPSGAPALPRARPRRDHRARRRPDAGRRHGRPLVPRGVVPPRRGHPDVPIDRVEELTVLDVDGTPPAQARERDLSEGTFRPAPDDLVVTLRLLPGATWVADYYPVESAEQVPAAEGGGLLVRMRTADTAWLHRLVWRLGGGGEGARPARGGRRGARGRRVGAHGLPDDRRRGLTRAAVVGVGAALGRAAARVGRLPRACAGRRVWGSTKGLGREVQRASELVAELEAAPTSCATSSPTRQRSPSHLTGCGRSIGSNGPRRRLLGTPVAPTGCRRGRAYTDARPRTTRHRRHTTSQEMDPMARIGPTEIIIVAVLIIVIFGWKKLPDAARSLGRSARVFKSEVDEMKENEASKSEASTTTGRSEPIEPAAPVDRSVPTVPTSDGSAVHENSTRTDNQSGPVA